MQIKVINKNNESLAFFTFFDHSNRNPQVTEWHKKVTEFYGIPWNYIPINYQQINHGGAIEYILKSLGNQIQYFAFFDNDCIPLTKDIHEIIYQKLKDKITLWGGCQNTNHIHKEQHHPFIAPSSFCISSELYKKIGQPSLQDLNPRSDHTEEATFRAQELGYNVSFVYPVNYEKLTKEEMELSGNPESWTLQKGKNFDIRYGLMTNYGNLFTHAMMQNLPRSNQLFIEKCQNIINPKLEAVIVSKNYGDYLELTLAENHKYFDNIIIVTDSEDTKTQEVCKNYKNVECYYFTEWNKNGAVFNKGGALNFGLSKLKLNGYVCIMDSDTVIKEDFKHKLTNKNLFYGSYRRFIPKLEDYRRLNTINSSTWDREKDNYEKIEGSGVGFLQIIHFDRLKEFQKSYGFMYPDSYSCDQVDINFLRQFCLFVDNEYLGLVRMNIETWHLGPHGTHHEGRKQDNFFN